MIKEKENGKYELHIADPAQRKKSIQVKVNLPNVGPKTINVNFSRM